METIPPVEDNSTPPLSQMPTSQSPQETTISQLAQFMRSTPVRILIVLFALVGLFSTAHFAYSAYVQRDLNNQGACTMEALLCPDGSAVGRTGPNCEFAPCPAEQPSQPTTIPTTAPTAALPASPTATSAPAMTISPTSVPNALPAEIKDAYSWPVQQICIENSGYVVYYQLDDGTNIYTHNGQYVRGKMVTCGNSEP